MQTVVNGMVQLTLPHSEGKDSETMASRLAALTKALKDKIPLKNGTIHKSREIREMKTEAKPSSNNGATANGFENKETSSVYITQHCSDLLKKTTSRLSTSQTIIEDRVSKSLHALRYHQLSTSHSHSSRQITSQYSTPSLNIATGSENLSSEATPPSGSPNVSTVSNRSSMDSDSMSPCLPDSSSHESLSLSSYSIQKHVQGLRSFVDEDMTCSSSDEEEDNHVLRNKRYLRRSK